MDDGAESVIVPAAYVTVVALAPFTDGPVEFCCPKPAPCAATVGNDGATVAEIREGNDEPVFLLRNKDFVAQRAPCRPSDAVGVTVTRRPSYLPLRVLTDVADEGQRRACLPENARERGTNARGVAPGALDRDVAEKAGVCSRLRRTIATGMKTRSIRSAMLETKLESFPSRRGYF